MFSWICRQAFHYIWRFKIVGVIPNHVPKKLYVVAPHTSNWDFPLGLFMGYAFKMEVGYIAKASIFRFPFGWFFRMMGGMPVNRKKTQGFVEAVVELINSKEKFCTTISPEGTREKVNKLKKGFYHIAKGANIPIVYVNFDWEKREVIYDTPKMIEDTYEKELEYLNTFFKNSKGKFPEKGWGYEA